jgi:hypothetical protein
MPSPRASWRSPGCRAARTPRRATRTVLPRSEASPTSSPEALTRDRRCHFSRGSDGGQGGRGTRRDGTGTVATGLTVAATGDVAAVQIGLCMIGDPRDDPRTAAHCCQRRPIDHLWCLPEPPMRAMATPAFRLRIRCLQPNGLLRDDGARVGLARTWTPPALRGDFTSWRCCHGPAGRQELLHRRLPPPRPGLGRALTAGPHATRLAGGR